MVAKAKAAVLGSSAPGTAKGRDALSKKVRHTKVSEV
jgi:hypothetical protein